jgi:hypothetical protein
MASASLACGRAASAVADGAPGSLILVWYGTRLLHGHGTASRRTGIILKKQRCFLTKTRVLRLDP